MNRIIIYKGDSDSFNKLLPKKYKTLSELVIKSDFERSKYRLEIPGKEYIQKKLKIENFIILNNEYSGVNNHIIENFNGFLNNYYIKNLFINNPPKIIENQLKAKFKSKVEIIHQNYKKFDLDSINKFNNKFKEKIIGQDHILKELNIFLCMNFKNETIKPIVIMFYGEPGIGKTETAKLLAESLGENLFRKQFSMFQNQNALDYLVGSTYKEDSLSKELQSRSSNIILFDEFDKVPNIFYSSFYQLFDEGILEDNVYKTKLKNSIIICTSNLKSEIQIKEKLGSAIFSRFDEFINFKELSEESSKLIISKEIDKLLSELSEDDLKYLNIECLKICLISNAKYFKNVREIRKYLKKLIYKNIFENIVKKNN
ncbi:AAA family ATPase [Clostridium perfringens]|nr:AAA family ATPase [Clostridium perfringens]